MTQEKSNKPDKLSGWDTTVVKGKGVMMRFLRPGPNPGQLEPDPWVTLSAKNIQSLIEELQQQAEQI